MTSAKTKPALVAPTALAGSRDNHPRKFFFLIHA
jgi:hypothetical protein